MSPEQKQRVAAWRGVTPPRSSPLDPLDGFFFKKHIIKTFLSAPTTRVALKSQLFQLLAVGAFLKTHQWDVSRRADRAVWLKWGKSCPGPPAGAAQRLCGTLADVTGKLLTLFRVSVWWFSSHGSCSQSCFLSGSPSALSIVVFISNT